MRSARVDKISELVNHLTREADRAFLLGLTLPEHAH